MLQQKADLPMIREDFTNYIFMEIEKGFYYVLALLIAFMCYEDETFNVNGVSAKQLLKYAKDLEPKAKISKLKVQHIETLLTELAALYILKKETEDTDGWHFVFARSAYREMLGSAEAVTEKLLVELTEGEEV